MKHPRKRRSGKISEAVFRGKKGEYTFEVYPVAAEIPETPAVFIFSRRKVHRTGHVSHAASCIGETASIPAELKRHKRSKCVKENLSNVVCILRDESDKHRTAVLDDIAGARSFGCVRSVFDPKNLRKPSVPPSKGAKKAAFGALVPSASLPLKPKRRKRAEPAQVKEADEVKRKRPASKSKAASESRSSTPKRRAVTAKPAKPVAKAAKPTQRMSAAKTVKVVKPVKAARPPKPAKVAKPVKALKKTRSAKSAAPLKKAAAKTTTRAKPKTAVTVAKKRTAAAKQKPKRSAANKPAQKKTVRLTRGAPGKAKKVAPRRTGNRKKAA